MTRSVTTLLLALWLASTASTAFGGLRPLLPGEKVVYQTVQAGANYRTFPNFVSQITGNAYTEYGDEVKLDVNNGGGPAAQFITNIAVGTQTFLNSNTHPYMDGVSQSGAANDPVDVGGFLELSIYYNDGPTDVAGDGGATDATPEGQAQPGTLLGRTRLPTPTYPQGGVSRSANGLNDPNNPNDETLDPWIINFPFPNVPIPANGIITFALINLNRFGVPDGQNSDGNTFGVWHALGSSTNTTPVSGGPFYNGTNYNTNVVGNSRTGAGPYSLSYSGQWTWLEYGALDKWESTRATNNVVEATIYAVVPEPSSIAMAVVALAGLVTVGMRRGRR